MPSSVLCPITVPMMELLEVVSSTRGQRVDDRANFVQEEPRDLQCWTTTLPINVVDDGSIYLDILTPEF